MKTTVKMIWQHKIFPIFAAESKNKENENRSGGSHRIGRLKDASST